MWRARQIGARKEEAFWLLPLHPGSGASQEAGERRVRARPCPYGGNTEAVHEKDGRGILKPAMGRALHSRAGDIAGAIGGGRRSWKVGSVQEPPTLDRLRDPRGTLVFGPGIFVASSPGLCIFSRALRIRGALPLGAGFRNSSEPHALPGAHAHWEKRRPLPTRAPCPRGRKRLGAAPGQVPQAPG